MSQQRSTPLSEEELGEAFLDVFLPNAKAIIVKEITQRRNQLFPTFPPVPSVGNQILKRTAARLVAALVFDGAMQSVRELGAMTLPRIEKRLQKDKEMTILAGSGILQVAERLYEQCAGKDAEEVKRIVEEEMEKIDINGSRRGSEN